MCVRVRERERESEQRRKSLFDWPVAFTKVKVTVANCTSAKSSEEHVNHMKRQAHAYPELSQYVDECIQTNLSGNIKCTNIAIQSRQKERERESKRDRVNKRENSNLKTLFYKDCSLGSVKNLPNN